MSEKLIIDDAHFAYLAVQRGKESDLRGDRAAWQEAFETSLYHTIGTMYAHLPERCATVLDVGSGLGGINILLARLYPDLAVTLLDGESDPPVVELHRKTFNDMHVAKDFLARNGVSRFNYFTPALGEPRAFDLIISCGSWCFHYEPAVYLDFVKACCRPGTVLILDVRRGKPEWRRDLECALGPASVVHSAEKFERLVFRV